MFIALIAAVAVLATGTVAVARKLATRQRGGSSDAGPLETPLTQRLILEEWRDGELVMIGTVIADERDALKVIGDAPDDG